MKTAAAAPIFKARRVIGLLTMVSLTVLSSGQAAAQGVTEINSCPFVIAAPGQYLVTQDLVCPGVGILIRSSDVKLNVGGHTISGVGLSNGAGIFVDAGTTNVEIRNGTITNFNHGILLQGTNGGRIDAITSTGNAIGLNFSGQVNDYVITSSEASNNTLGVDVRNNSNGNVFRGNKVIGNLGIGYLLSSRAENNLITGSKASASIITGNQSHGVVLFDSDNNTVQSSQVLGNLARGIWLAGGANNNTVKGNTVNENGTGITVGSFATANTIVSNTATGNAVVDLEDDNPNCDANVWQHNNFNTANQPQCIN